MNNNGKCVLMFSGGRDSTIAAVRLAHAQRKLVLVTVTSDHLVGIEAVVRRIASLKAHLPGETEWLQVMQPILPSLGPVSQTTCLPCQRAYVALGAILSLQLHACDLALGYTKYQSAWPEQTPQAGERLKGLFRPFGLRLLLPVYDLESKAEAERELARYGLAGEALEQKCLKHEGNIEIPPDVLERELDSWVYSISECIISTRGVPIVISAKLKIAEV